MNEWEDVNIIIYFNFEKLNSKLFKYGSISQGVDTQIKLVFSAL